MYICLFIGAMLCILREPLAVSIVILYLVILQGVHLRIPLRKDKCATKLLRCRPDVYFGKKAGMDVQKSPRYPMLFLNMLIILGGPGISMDWADNMLQGIEKKLFMKDLIRVMKC